MRKTIALAVAVAMITSVFLAAGPAMATDDGYNHGNDAEHHPNCRGENGERQPTGFVLDLDEVDPQNLFDDDAKIPVEVDITTPNGEQVLAYCTGEQWDGQDPNTKESDRNSETGGSADEPLVDAQEGDVYVNPLWSGDCSGWNSTHHVDGCKGGTDKPKLSEPVHARATADAPGPSDDEERVGVYVNEEAWGLHRCAYAIVLDHEAREWNIFNYCEDHSDQLVAATGQEPLMNSLAESATDNNPDGNVQCIPFGIPQGGTCAEGDCTSHKYQHTSEKHKDGKGGHTHSCTRDNTVFFIGFQIGYSWLDLPSTQVENPTESPPALP